MIHCLLRLILGVGLVCALVLPLRPGTARGAEPAAADRLLDSRCLSQEGDTPACGDIATSIRRWSEEGGQATGVDPGGMSIAAVVGLESVLTSSLLASHAEVAVAGSARLVWWKVGAGIVHQLDTTGYGFTLGASAGLYVDPGSRWSVFLGARFINMASFYGDAADRPAHDLLGSLGASVALGELAGVHFRIDLAATIGVRRRLVADFDEAREVVHERFDAEYGGTLGVSMWLR